MKIVNIMLRGKNIINVEFNSRFNLMAIQWNPHFLQTSRDTEIGYFVKSGSLVKGLHCGAEGREASFGLGCGFQKLKFHFI